MSAMTVQSQSLEIERPRARLNLSRHRGLIAAVAVFAALIAFVEAITPKGLSFYDVSSLITTGAPLALASVGQTFVIIVGGFDLSAGAAISLVNAVVATIPQQSVGGQIGAVAAGLAIGLAIGAFNGFFVAFLRLQSIVVTLSTMFLVRGLTLLIMPDPGGSVSDTLTKLFTGAAIPGILPSAAVVIAGGVAIWLLVRRTKFGTAMFAVGSDADASHAVGIPVEWTRFGAFILGGLFYGMAGVYIGAQTGSADPLVGDPLLLQSFTAVVLGGTLLGGGRGGAVGSVIGAYTLMLMINILLALDVSAYYSTIAEGVVLILAVVAASVGSDNVAVQSLRRAGVWLRARSAGVLASQVATGVSAPAERRETRPRPATTQRASWLDRNREQLRYVLPAYVAFVLVVVATQFVYRENIIFSLKYYDSLVVLSAFLAILALGQGAVILSGGLDLSVPWTMGFCGILAAGLIQGSNVTTIWAVPLALAVGIVIGAFNGLGVAALGLPPIVVTLAMNGILQGAALLFSNGTPAGFASPALRWMMTGRIGGITPVVALIGLFIMFGVTLLGRTVFGRWVYAVGNSPRASYLSGVGVRSTTIGVYALSGFCAALVGVLFTGFSGQASLGMGDDFLLPSIAVVIVGGTLITGGRGTYIGMLGGVLLLTALQTLLAGTTLPHAVRDIIFGAVVLVSVLALREK
jgi:ribose transport system permease protein